MAPRTNPHLSDPTYYLKAAAKAQKAFAWSDGTTLRSTGARGTGSVLAALGINKGFGDSDGPGLDERMIARAYAKIIAANFIVGAREKAGFTQAELAARLGVARPYLAQLESPGCDKKVPLDTLVAISYITGVSLYVGDPADLAANKVRARLTPKRADVRT